MIMISNDGNRNINDISSNHTDINNSDNRGWRLRRRGGGEGSALCEGA